MSSSAGRRNSTHFAVQRQTDALVEFETFKRKYLGINKHITKLNSTLSVRIEALNAQLSELAVENLQLRAQNIQLNAQLSREREKTRRVLNDAEAAAAGLVARLGSLRDVYGVERGPPTPVSPPRKPTTALPRAPGASTPPPRIKVSRPPAFCALPEQDELGSFTDGAPLHGEREDIPPRPGSRCDMAPAGAGVAASTGPIRTSKSRTVRRQSGLIIDMLREDREQRDRDREQRDRAAQGIARLPTPTSSSAEEMDVTEVVPAPPPGSTTDFDAFAALSTPERRCKARRLSGPVPSPPRQTREDVDEEAQVDFGLVLGRDSPLTEPEPEHVPEPEEDERERIEREREAILRAARKRQKEDRAREREERAREREQKEREREQKEREREQKERLRVEREKLRERKSAERLEQMEKEELAPTAPVPVQADAQVVVVPAVKDAPRVPFEPVTNASGALAPPTAPVKKRSIPSLVPASTTTNTAAKQPSRIPGLSLVVNGDAARPQSPTDSVLVVPSISLPVSRKPERLQVPVTLPPVERERSRERERERASVERERTPPPQPESASVPVAAPAVEDGRTRRVRSSVNYAEPKLNTKMRRPDPEEGGPAWPPTSRRKKSAAATTSTSGTRPRVTSAEDMPREDGAPEDPLASRRHTIAV